MRSKSSRASTRATTPSAGCWTRPNASRASRAMPQPTPPDWWCRKIRCRNTCRSRARPKAGRSRSSPFRPSRRLACCSWTCWGCPTSAPSSTPCGWWSRPRASRWRPQDIPLDDDAAFALLRRGRTVGVFQMEGAGMTRTLRELAPTSIGEVAAIIALYRPGPDGQHPHLHRPQTRAGRRRPTSTNAWNPSSAKPTASSSTPTRCS